MSELNREKYALATGEEAEYRLKIVNSVHGADTEAFLLRAGMKPGLRVADIGCGTGVISCWLAKLAGVDGQVVGVDISEAQIQSARKSALEAGLTNIGFLSTGCYETGLESESVELVFSRFMLMHVQEPMRAILEMKRILKPGGVLAIEDGDFNSTYAEPPSAAYERMFELYRLIGAKHGEDFLIGRKLYRMALEAGFHSVSARLAQPVFTQGDAKRLPEWTLAEAAPGLLEAGLTNQGEIDSLIRTLAAEAANATTLFAMARMAQVIGVK